MYLLNCEESMEFRSFFIRSLTGKSEPWRAGSQEGLALRRRFKQIDRGFRNEIRPSHETREVLKLLTGAESNFNYSSLRLGKKLSAGSRRNIARAMVLSEAEPGVFDILASKLTEEVFQAAVGDDMSFSFAVKGHPDLLLNSSESEPVSWKELLQGALRIHFSTEPNLILGLPELELTLLSAHSKINLKLALDRKGERLSWTARGLSALKKSHSALASDLNGVLEDYRLRLQWMDEYQSAPIVPSLDPLSIDTVKSNLQVFYKNSSIDYSILQGGVSFGDDPIFLDRNHSEHAFVARCEKCNRIAAIEVMSYFGDNPEQVNWNGKSDVHHSTVVENRVNPTLKHSHEYSGCSWSTAVSSRGGQKITI